MTATVSVVEVPGGAVVELAGEIDLANADRVRRALLAGAAAGELVVDLAGVTYLDSVGVHLLFEVAATARTSGRRLLLALPAESPVRRLLEVSSVDERMDVHPSREQAEAALAGAAGAA